MADRGIENRRVGTTPVYFPAEDGLRLIAQSGDVLYGSTSSAVDTQLAQGAHHDFTQGTWIKADGTGDVAITLDYVTLDDRVDEGGGGGGSASGVSVEGYEEQELTDQQSWNDYVWSGLLAQGSSLSGKLDAEIADAVGYLIVGSGGDHTGLAPGTDGQVLTADSNEPLGIKWADPA